MSSRNVAGIFYLTPPTAGLLAILRPEFVSQAVTFAARWLSHSIGMGSVRNVAGIPAQAILLLVSGNIKLPPDYRLEP